MPHPDYFGASIAAKRLLAQVVPTKIVLRSKEMLA